MAWDKWKKRFKKAVGKFKDTATRVKETVKSRYQTAKSKYTQAKGNESKKPFFRMEEGVATVGARDKKESFLEPLTTKEQATGADIAMTAAFPVGAAGKKTAGKAAAAFKWDKRVFKMAKEYLDAAPHVADDILAAGKKAAGKAKGLHGVTAQQLYAVNSKTSALTAGILSKLVAQFKKPLFVYSALGGLLTTYPLAEWANIEALQQTSFAEGAIARSDDPQALKEYSDQLAEIWDVSMWEKIGRMFPGTNLVVNFRRTIKTAMIQYKVNSKILADQIWKIENNMTEADVWDKIRQDNVDNEKEAVDYYNEQRKQQVIWEAEFDRKVAEAEEAVRDARREKDLEAENKAVDYYNEQRKQQLVWEAEFKRYLKFLDENEKKELEEINEFYRSYRRTRISMGGSSRMAPGSSLGFGLL